MKISVLAVLTLSCVIKVFCSSGLDILAAVASSKKHVLTSLPESFTLSSEDEDLAKAIVVDSDPVQQIIKYHSSCKDSNRYLAFLLRLLELFPLEFWPLSPSNYEIISEFVEFSQYLPETTNLIDLSKLSEPIRKAISCLAISRSNMPLFIRLVKSGSFVLNGTYTYAKHTGNAIVMLYQNYEMFQFAISRGLDLNRTVLDPEGNEISSKSFLVRSTDDSRFVILAYEVLHGNELIILPKRRLEPIPESSESSSFKRAKTPNEKQSKLKPLRERKRIPNGVITAPEFFGEIYRRLHNDGLDGALKLVKTNAQVMDREDFLPLLRSLLKDDFKAIASIYGAKINKTREILRDRLRAQFNEKEFSLFFFELLKHENGHDIVPSCFNDWNLVKLLKSYDFSQLPQKTLTAIAFAAVKHNNLDMMEKVAAADKSGFEAKYKLNTLVETGIFAHVRDTKTLQKLFNLKIALPESVDDGKQSTPFVYHFMTHRNPAVKEVILRTNAIPKDMFLKALEYCNAVGNSAVHDEIAKHLGFTKFD